MNLSKKKNGPLLYGLDLEQSEYGRKHKRILIDQWPMHSTRKLYVCVSVYSGASTMVCLLPFFLIGCVNKRQKPEYVIYLQQLMPMHAIYQFYNGYECAGLYISWFGCNALMLFASR